MAGKLTSRQQSQLTWLNTLPQKLERLTKIVELMAVQQADEAMIRGGARLSDELKSQAGGIGLHPLADGFGYIGVMLRRSGAAQVRVRGMRELLAGIRMNAEGARRSASTPEETEEGKATS